MRKVIFGITIVRSPFISLFEKNILKHKKTSGMQPIFIIGAPRTGSTILYQALTNYSDVSYIDNLACKWHRNLLFGFWLSENKNKNKAHNNFKADHGNTKRFGSRAPSECGAFWYRWLPKEYHFIDNDQITTKMTEEIQHEISSVINYFDKPLLFKNLNAGQRLRLIYKAFPQAKFIYIKRDPRFVILSILNARKKNKIQPNQWWSIMSSNYQQLLLLPEETMVAAQVYSLEQQIEKDLKLFPKKNIKKIHFQSLSKELINELIEWMDVDIRKAGSLPEFRKDDVKNISNEELVLLTQLFTKYSFPREQFI